MRLEGLDDALRHRRAVLLRYENWPELAEAAGLTGTNSLVTDSPGPAERPRKNFDIFEGTEQIQQLVIAWAISGLRIEWLDRGPELRHKGSRQLSAASSHPWWVPTSPPRSGRGWVR